MATVNDRPTRRSSHATPIDGDVSRAGPEMLDALVGVPTAPVDPDVGESGDAGPEAPQLPTPLAEGPVHHPNE